MWRQTLPCTVIIRRRRILFKPQRNDTSEEDQSSCEPPVGECSLDGAHQNHGNVTHKVPWQYSQRRFAPLALTAKQQDRRSQTFFPCSNANQPGSHNSTNFDIKKPSSSSSPPPPPPPPPPKPPPPPRMTRLLDVEMRNYC